MTLDELWKAYEDKTQTLSEDIYEFMGGQDRFGITVQKFDQDYGTYFGDFDPTVTNIAERKRDINFKEARNLLDTTIDATDRVYATEMDTLSAGYETEADKARSISGGIGLRTGALDEALEDSYEKSANKARNLGERLELSQDAARDKYNIAMVDSALDFEKISAEEKKEFYDHILDQLWEIGNTDFSEYVDSIGEGGRDGDPNTAADQASTCVEALGDPWGSVGTQEFEDWSHARNDCMGVGYTEDITKINPIVPPGSDIRLKENIVHVSNSPSGLKVYHFDYKDKSFGNGRYEGVMSHEIPTNAVIKGYDGYDRVYYDKLDVDFKRIK